MQASVCKWTLFAFEVYSTVLCKHGQRWKVTEYIYLRTVLKFCFILLLHYISEGNMVLFVLKLIFTRYFQIRKEPKNISLKHKDQKIIEVWKVCIVSKSGYNLWLSRLRKSRNLNNKTHQNTCILRITTMTVSFSVASCHSELSVHDAGQRGGESSHQRRPVHHLSSCQALLRVPVLHGERQWVRLEVRPGRGWEVREMRRGA